MNAINTFFRIVTMMEAFYVAKQAMLWLNMSGKSTVLEPHEKILEIWAEKCCRSIFKI